MYILIFLKKSKLIVVFKKNVRLIIIDNVVRTTELQV